MHRLKMCLLLVMVLVLGISFYYNDKVVISASSIVYKDGSSTNLVLNKILKDNSLKEETKTMFNDASDESTTGLYYNKDEDGTTYYYRGDVKNNNIVFGEYTEDYYVYHKGEDSNYFQSVDSCNEANKNRSNDCITEKIASAGDKMYWKIIRVNGDGSLRLLYTGPGLNLEFTSVSFDEDDNSGSIGYSPYNLVRNDPKYTGYTYDNGQDSFIKKEVDTWYNNTLGKSSYESLIEDGRFCSDSSGYKLASEYGFNYNNTFMFSSSNRLEQVFLEPPKDNLPSFICQTSSESYGGSYRLKVGLITADELVLAGASIYTKDDTYLSPGSGMTPFWTMTPAYYEEDNAGYVYFESSDSSINDTYVDSHNGIRPVINVTTENMTLIGDGTSNNPYLLTDADITNYNGTISLEEGSSIDINSAFDEDVDLSNVIWTSEDDSIARIENNKIVGLSEGRTKITGVSSDGLTSYEIDVTVISNPVTNSMTYIGIGLVLILVLGTALFTVYRIKVIVNDD